MADSQRLAERGKYTRMWADAHYRKNSPGLNVAPLAFHTLDPAPGESIIDYGCGEGKAADWFAKHGLTATGVDIVKMRPDIIEACLWDLPELESDYAFSADVLEHVPPNRVEQVLTGIRNRTRKAGFFTIATCHDVHGDRIGETLHLTVQPIEWWRDVLTGIFSTVETGQGDRDWRYWAYVTV